MNTSGRRVAEIPDDRPPIDVGRWIDEIESGLRSGDEREVDRALAILRRWQFDPMIDAESRERARELVRNSVAWTRVTSVS